VTVVSNLTNPLAVYVLLISLISLTFHTSHVDKIRPRTIISQTAPSYSTTLSKHRILNVRSIEYAI
jgi:hypothetical protein